MGLSTVFPDRSNAMRMHVVVVVSDFSRHDKLSLMRRLV
jgi:hypothetical protein